MKLLIPNLFRWRLSIGGLMALAWSARMAAAPIPVDEESPWPRVRTTNGNVITLHQPQVETWSSNSFTARAAVGLKMAGAKAESLGVIWLTAHGNVDHSNRLVTLDHLEITQARFPDAPDGGSNALTLVREVVPAGARTVSLDYLITALGFAQAAARQGPRGLKDDPPEIIWTTNRAVLVIIDGEPVLKPVPNTTLQRVVNTPALILFDKEQGRFYLNGEGPWYSAASLQDAWSFLQTPPPAVAAFIPAAGTSAQAPDPKPRILVRTHPAELLTTSGLPDFRPVRGTSLQYSADTDRQLFFHSTDREAYLLLSGRWYKAKSLSGPWTHVAPRDLPADFGKIPPGSPQAVVLASVPNTRQAQLAVLANSVPTTATVNRREARTEVTYDGEPKFKPIEGTRMSYAANATLPVVLASGTYYALDNGVWFVSGSAGGPWSVATEVPEEIYTIPPSSPVYYATFVNVYPTGDDEVEVAYTAGYQGAYEEDGTVVYGTGWEYEPWYGDEYYGWGWTWGYDYIYVPWYQWWVWRNWWDQPGGLRSSIIENVYDRWQSRPGVSHHDGAVSTPGTSGSGVFKPSTDNAFKGSADNAFKSPASGAFKSSGAYKGYPAQYGRYQGATGPAPLTPPQNTVALNPYTRPSSAVRPGEVPRGAQLLTTLRQSPSGGRDLYASPDGNVYLRKADGWYRREGGGQWKFAAPTQGTMERSQAAAAGRGGSPSGAGNVLRPAPGGRGQGRINRGPDTGFEARPPEIASLEREYYARSLAQLRAENWGGNRARPARGGGRRR